MKKVDRETILLSEHILEVRHDATGKFLDSRGYIADYIRSLGLFPHWNIDQNLVNFRDSADRVIKEGAFVGYRSAGYSVLDAPTRNFFADRATSYWKKLVDNGHYKIPKPTRFGARTKVFIPSHLSFDEINNNAYQRIYTSNARLFFGGKEKDLNFTIEMVEDEFDVRVSGGPVNSKEASRYFQFNSDHFDKCGLFLDVDFYKTLDLSIKAIPKLTEKAMRLSWERIEKIAVGLGI